MFKYLVWSEHICYVSGFTRKSMYIIQVVPMLKYNTFVQENV